MVHVLETKAAFDSALTKAGDKLVVIDFYANWCGPCHVVAPKYQALAGKYGEVADFYKVDVDENEETSEHCGITCMPTFQIYKNATKVATVEGANIHQLEAEIEKAK